jgi:hypothetical protein
VLFKWDVDEICRALAGGVNILIFLLEIASQKRLLNIFQLPILKWKNLEVLK